MIALCVYVHFYGSGTKAARRNVTVEHNVGFSAYNVMRFGCEIKTHIRML